MYTGDSPNCQMSMVAMAGSTSCQYFSFSARAAEMQGYHNQCDYCRTDTVKDAYHHLVVLK